VTAQRQSELPRILDEQSRDILDSWVREQLHATSQSGAISEGELRAQCSDFLTALRDALRAGGATSSVGAAVWAPARELLGGISRSRAAQGFSPAETATFVFSLKAPVFASLRRALGDEGTRLADEILTTSEVLDRLGLFTTEVYQKGREEIIFRQQQDLLELSTPVVSLWDGILALPLIGTLDSARTQVVMENMLQRIVETGAQIAIIDITGVPTVDTLTAQHLLKTVTAARLMGGECVISGIRPQIAQTIVHLGVDLGNVVTKATLADAFRWALTRTGSAVTPVRARPS